jgi:hypothetical protein
MASLNPFKKIAARIVSNASVTAIWLFIHIGVNGFCLKCAAASAADSVIVMTKSVVAKPSRIRAEVLPVH